MTDHPENPPARPFDEPLHPHIGLGYGEWPQYPGASMRDYFAAAALPVMLHRDFYSPSSKYETISPSSRSHPLWVARACYRYADAMLRERGK